ncbi:MAG: phosphoribosyltransferase family protein [Candidatus Pacebacteria bacterium]|nr:phosphoribosyltransferase family protein [Candidatus Paceibacterota bacterium]
MENFFDKILNLFFPKKCINCQQLGSYLCYDCFSLIEIMQKEYDLSEEIKYLDRLFFATVFKNQIVRKLIHGFKYPPFIKDLSDTLSDIMIIHLTFIGMKSQLSDFILVPIPISKKRMNYRGYNQAEELAKKLSLKLKLETRNILKKIKENSSQVDLDKEQRKNNVENVFSLMEDIKGKNILLIDDVFTTGATIDEAAKILKQNGANQVWAAVVARE